MASTADLLSVDAEAVAAAVTTKALEAEKATIGALSEADLQAEIAAVEADLAKALSALSRKGEAKRGGLPATKGPCAVFEGTPIDCGAVADAIVGEYLASMTEARLKEMTAQTEADLTAARAALERKKSGLPPAPPPSAPAGASASTSAAKPAAGVPTSPLAEKATQIMGEASEKANDLLEEASAKTGMPKATVAATMVGIAAGAAAAGVALIGRMFKR